MGGIVEEGDSGDKREGVDGQEGVNLAAALTETKDGVSEDSAARKEVFVCNQLIDQWRP